MEAGQTGPQLKHLALATMAAIPGLETAKRAEPLCQSRTSAVPRWQQLLDPQFPTVASARQRWAWAALAISGPIEKGQHPAPG